MKKIISMFALVGLFAFVAPIAASACVTVNFKCGSTSAGVVVICDDADYQAWNELLCGQV